MIPKAGMDAVAMRKNPCAYQEKNAGLARSHYTGSMCSEVLLDITYIHFINITSLIPSRPIFLRCGRGKR
jgi:hypothetical protein